MAKYHVGMVGAGGIAEQHLATLSRSRSVKSIGIYDPAEDRARKIAKTFSCEVRSDVDQLVAQSDVVWICSPPFAHREPIHKAASAGKAIFCEKPLALGLRECRQLKQRVEDANVPFFMGLSCRFIPVFQKIRQMIDKGDLGEPTMIWSNRVGYLTGPTAVGWRMDDQKSGGVVVEFAVHELDFIRWVGGEFARVAAVTSDKTINPGRFTDTASITGVLQSGACAQVNVSWANPRYEWRRGVQGTEAAVHYDDSVFNQVLLMRPGKEPKAVTVKPDYWLHPETGENMAFVNQARSIFKSLDKGQPPAVGIDDGLTVTEVTDAVAKSAKTGRFITIKGV